MSRGYLFQKTFYVLFISLTVIFYFTRLKKHRNHGNITFPMKSSNFSSAIGETFLIWERMNNITEMNVSNILYDEFDVDKDVEPIYILGLFELTTKLGRRNDGETELMATKMAVKHVNALNVLPGYELVLLVNDTQCDPGVAIDRFFHAIYSKYTILMLLGSVCSNVTEALAHIVPYWNILQVSYGSESPKLSDRNKFPLFFRTVSPDSSHNVAKVHFVQHFKWHVVAAFSQSENAHLLPINHLITELEKVNVSCISTVTFSIDNYKEQLRVLKSLDIRIIIGSFSLEMAPLIFCAVYHLGMYGGEYVWILKQHEDNWWNYSTFDCSFQELTEAIEGSIMIGDFQEGYIDNHLFRDVKHNPSLFNDHKKLTKYAKQSYDAIWAMSLTLKMSKVQSIESFHYKRKDVISSFLETMAGLQFVGLSGPIKFKGADRVGDVIVNQIQDNRIVSVAIYESLKDFLNFKCRMCKEINWKHGQVPIAQRHLKEILVSVPNTLFYLVGGISIGGVVCSLAFLYFNLKYRKMTTVKLSSPNLNNLAVIGCIMVYISVMLHEAHNISMKMKAYFNELCWVKIYLLSAGFSLTFGSMFAKSYRVHRLFTYSIPSLVKDKLLKDQQLISLILIPLSVDTLIMGLWIALDPLGRHLHDLVLEDSNEDPRVVYQPQVELCLCQNTIGWHIALFGYKSIILIMGVYMAWRTRHVKVPALNESHYVAICIYSAVFSTAIVIAFSFVSEYFVLSYLAKTFSILASTTITLVLMFLPKIKSVFGQIDTELSIMQSMGLRIECNTRRFISDDRKEILSRMEIQNKVYRCQLQALDREILRLDELLLKNSERLSENIVRTLPEIYFLSVPESS